MQGNEVLKKYVLSDGFQTFTYLAKPNTCFFCHYMTDIYYDWHGIYCMDCYKGLDTKKGCLGKCKYFKED